MRLTWLTPLRSEKILQRPIMMSVMEKYNVKQSCMNVVRYIRNAYQGSV